MRPRPLLSIRLASPALLVTTFAGCAHLVYHPSGDAHYPARDASCQLQLTGSHPGPAYVEIGQVTRQGEVRITDPQEFLDKVRPDVCAAGGEVLATEVNGSGLIVRALVFRKAATASAGNECDPICSPGFQCAGKTCVPQCNPACLDTESCGRDRLCHPR
jgi:hypothetical protein